jgi:hypothetical protein
MVDLFSIISIITSLLKLMHRTFHESHCTCNQTLALNCLPVQIKTSISSHSFGQSLSACTITVSISMNFSIPKPCTLTTQILPICNDNESAFTLSSLQPTVGCVGTYFTSLSFLHNSTMALASLERYECVPFSTSYRVCSPGFVYTTRKALRPKWRSWNTTSKWLPDG